MYITVDIGGTKAKVSSFENESTTSFIESIDLKIEDMLTYHKAVSDIVDAAIKIAKTETIEAIGISCRGDIDPVKGLIIDTSYMPDWNQRSIVNDIREKLNCPVKIDNDAVCAAISEISLLRTNKYKNFTFVAIGTGIGGTKITKFSNSMLINPWDFGHVIVERNGIECKCGQKGCLEAYVSGWGIEARYGKKLEDITENTPWIEIVEYMAQAIVSYLSVNPTESFIFGGGIIFKRPGLVDEIEKKVREMTTYQLGLPRFELSRYLEHAQSYGALALITAGDNLINMNYL